MRGGSKESKKEKVRLVLSWVAYGFALAGGAAIAATFVGDVLAGLVGLFPGWVAIIVFVAGIIATGIDLFLDSEPNKVALYVAMVLPSVARAVPGKLSDAVTSALNHALSQVTNALGAWLGAGSAFGFAVTLIAVALLMARRTVVNDGR